MIVGAVAGAILAMQSVQDMPDAQAQAIAMGVGDRWTIIEATDTQALFIDFGTYQEATHAAWFYVHLMDGTYHLQQIAADCTAGEITTPQWLEYRYDSEAAVSQGSTPEPRSPVPHSLGEAALETLCDPYGALGRPLLPIPPLPASSGSGETTKGKARNLAD